MSNTLHPLIRELEARSSQIAGMNLTVSLQDEPISGELLNMANRAADLDRSGRAVEALVSRAGLSRADAEVAVRQMLNERHFYGSYCELGTYDWLDRHNVRFRAQVKLAGQEVLNPNGCSLISLVARTQRSARWCAALSCS